jgi:hypothetical protein
LSYPTYHFLDVILIYSDNNDAKYASHPRLIWPSGIRDIVATRCMVSYPCGFIGVEPHVVCCLPSPILTPLSAPLTVTYTLFTTASHLVGLGAAAGGGVATETTADALATKSEFIIKPPPLKILHTCRGSGSMLGWIISLYRFTQPI